MPRPSCVILAGALILVACGGREDPTPSATPSPTADVSPSTDPSPTPSPSPTEQTSASEEPTESAVPSPDPGASGDPQGFVVPPNPTADILFLERDECENRELGYTLKFPEDWWTNTAIGNVPACSWFSPTFYEVPDPSVVPDQIAIEIFLVPADRGYLRDIIGRQEVIVGGTQLAARLEIDGSADGSDGGSYEYVIQLGPTLEEGPNLVARTDTAMGGDFDISKGVLDRMMATIHFIGTVQ